MKTIKQLEKEIEEGIIDCDICKSSSKRICDNHEIELRTTLTQTKEFEKLIVDLDNMEFMNIEGNTARTLIKEELLTKIRGKK